MAISLAFPSVSVGSADTLLALKRANACWLSDSDSVLPSLMGIFDSAERRQREKAKDSARAAVISKIEDRLIDAIDAADQGDIFSEERAILEARQIAASAREWGWDPQRDWGTMVASLMGEGKLRRGKDIGQVDQTFIYDDRILCLDERAGNSDPRIWVHSFEPDTHAEVMTEGELRTTSRPTLTRMALGSVLPGSALIPGFALQKKSTEDARRLFFTIEQERWGKIIELDPQRNDIADVRQLAMDVNHAAASLKNPAAVVDGSTRPPSSTAERLRDLGQLRDEGLITDEEFQAKREQLVQDI